MFDRYLLDGFDPCGPITQRPTAYEFHGCPWHGRLKCFSKNHNRFPLPHGNRYLQEVYEANLQKQEDLR